MKKLFLLSTLLVISCTPETNEPVIEEKEDLKLDYSIAENDHVKWGEIFSREEKRYMVYFYSNYCGYCRMLKEDILNYYLLNKEKMYFVNAIEENAVFGTPASGIIGLKCIEDFYIAGTPTLVEFTNWIVTNLYSGLDNIKMYIESC